MTHALLRLFACALPCGDDCANTGCLLPYVRFLAGFHCNVRNDYKVYGLARACNTECVHREDNGTLDDRSVTALHDRIVSAPGQTSGLTARGTRTRNIRPSLLVLVHSA